MRQILSEPADSQAMSSPIDHVMKLVEWRENGKPANLTEGELWATHSGEMKLGEISLRVHRLSNDQRVIDADDFHKLFDGIPVGREKIPKP